MNKKPIAAAATIALVMGIDGPAMAQDQTDLENVLIEEVMVTATKREESIYEVPVAVSAFTEDTIFKQGIVDITDIGKFVPNMTVTGFLKSVFKVNHIPVRKPLKGKVGIRRSVMRAPQLCSI